MSEHAAAAIRSMTVVSRQPPYRLEAQREERTPQAKEQRVVYGKETAIAEKE